MSQIEVSTASTNHPNPAPGFIFKRSRQLKTLNLSVEEYEHQATGAVHYHLASDNPENVFLVALRTVPMDSTGVAHILEHTALCGSERFPVRDPFFMMIRRSMNTFMNAFTSSDWTAYPFASQNRKDFNNLLEVYLDAVFFSRLHELDFAQEGHRLEFQEADNPNSQLEYKGVVYNEMKGAMSSANAYIWQLLSSHLFPTTTYHYNSGGDPAHIPQLSYQQLRDFYKTHYHPSNAIFMTYGDISAAEHQEKFEKLALSRFEKLDVHIAVEDEQRFSTPLEITESYPLDDENSDHKTHVIMAWLLGKSTDLEALYKAQLLSSVLLDNSASPLLQALETSKLGSSPSPLCGLEDSNREMSFLCGLEGCTEDATEEVKQLILDTLEKVAAEGVDQDKVEAALHALELHQREINGDSYPYGLQLILTALSTATHRGDPLELLDIDPVLDKLKQDIKDPDYIPRLIRDELLSNPHRLLLTVKPDTTLSARQTAAEAERLQQIQENLDEAAKQKIIEQSQALQQRQAQEDDLSILPKVELSDVPNDVHWPTGKHGNLQLASGDLPYHFYDRGTNGIAYQHLILPLPAIPQSLQALLPLYASCLTELGAGEHSYLDMQARQSRVSGGFNAHISMRSKLGDEQALQSYLILSGKSLYENHSSLSSLMQETLQHCRFDEQQRIHELVRQMSSRREQGITGQGHSLAMGLACSGLSPIARYEYENAGLAGIKNMKSLVGELSDAATLEQLCQQLAELHALIQKSPHQALLIAEASEEQALQQALGKSWQDSTLPGRLEQAFSLPKTRQATRAAWVTSTQVNFCARAYPSVGGNHEDAAALTVLGGYLRNGYLHRAIREQGGAYGGGASQDSGTAAFRFFSYRDPRLEGTLDDFDASVRWLLDKPQDPSQVEEAILGVISSLDKPASPAGAARQAYFNELFGRNKEQRIRFRQQVLAVDLDNLRQVAERYLQPENASTGIVTHKANAASLEQDGFKLDYL